MVIMHQINVIADITWSCISKVNVLRCQQQITDVNPPMPQLDAAAAVAEGWEVEQQQRLSEIRSSIDQAGAEQRDSIRLSMQVLFPV